MRNKLIISLGTMLFLMALTGFGVRQLEQSNKPEQQTITLDTQWVVEAQGADFRKVGPSSPVGSFWGLTFEDHVYTYDGEAPSKWELQADIQDAVVRDVQFINTVEGWATGYIPSKPAKADGAIWRFDGQAWTEVSVPSTSAVDQIDMLDGNFGYAVGQDDTLRYGDFTWTRLSQHTPDLIDISAVSPTELWGVAYDGIHKFDGADWTQPQVITGLFAIDMDPGNNTGWAVGSGGRIYQYNGSVWAPQTSNTTNNLYGVTIRDTNDVWAVGDDGTILHYESGTWTAQSFVTLNPLVSIAFVADAGAPDGWSGWIGGVNSTLLKYSNGSWANQGLTLVDPPAVTSENIYGISMISSTLGWAVGGDFFGDGAILQYSASGWAVSSNISGTIKHDLYDVDMVDSTDGWAVGGDLINGGKQLVRYTGGKWTPVNMSGTALFTSTALFAVDMVSSSDGWAVGGDFDFINGDILHYTGDDWVQAAIPPNTAALFDVDMVDASDGWAVGDNNTLIQYDGAQWQDKSDLLIGGGTLNTARTYNLAAVQMLDASNGWAVGESVSNYEPEVPEDRAGLILKYNGTDWQPVGAANSALADVELRDVYILADGTGWAVGDGGVGLYYDGSQWILVSQFRNFGLNAIQLLDDKTGWIVGDGGAILTLEEKPFIVYLPYIAKQPTPTPTNTATPTSTPQPTATTPPTPTPTATPLPQFLYSWDFSWGDGGWPRYSSSDPNFGGYCSSYWSSATYWMNIPSANYSPCLRGAPSQANYQEGIFETKAFVQSSNLQTTDAYGIYVNGRGGSEYYLFRYRPVACKWELIRRQGNDENRKRSGSCSDGNFTPALDGKNVLKMSTYFDPGTSKTTISVYINGSRVGTLNDTPGALTGNGTGLFTETKTGKKLDVRFEYFTVRPCKSANCAD